MLITGSINGAIWWRLRGGALTTLSGWDPGTGGMRAIAALVISALPLSAGGRWWVLLAPALWLGWSVAGWGAFQGMGKSPVGVKNPLERLLARWMAPLPMCLVGMAIEGAYCLAIPGLVAGWITASPIAGLIVMFAGVGFSPLYYFAQTRRSVPDLGQFEHGGSELAECLVGGWIGFILTLIALAYAT